MLLLIQTADRQFLNTRLLAQVVLLVRESFDRLHHVIVVSYL